MLEIKFLLKLNFKIFKIWKKKDVDFIGTEFLTFNPVSTLYFENELSNGSLNDSITFINVPLMVIVKL